MSSDRTTATIVGILYIIGTVAGVLSVVFAGAIIDDSEYLIKISEHENQIKIGALCILIMGLALAMVPVMMFSILKKYSQPLALGYVVFRGALETITYFASVIIWLSLLTLSQEYVKADAADVAYFDTLGTLLREAVVWIDPIGSIVFTLGALMLYYAFYQTKLIPRWLSGWGLIGAVLVLILSLSGIFGTDLEILWAPLALQEMVMALWLIIKGFDASALDALSTEN